MEAARGRGEQRFFVLSPSIVRWAVRTLREQAIHSFFTAYLIIRRQASLLETTEVEPNWEPLNVFLNVPGGPPEKPWFRPFNQQTDSTAYDWMKRHPAGSWNTSSVRTGTPGAEVLEIRGKAFLLPENHFELALQHLLYGERAQVLAIGTFFYRNFAFTSDSAEIGPKDLVDLFRRDFGYRAPEDDREFETIFQIDVPERADWFEPWPARAGEER
jgi:hypothetical protein